MSGLEPPSPPSTTYGTSGPAHYCIPCCEDSTTPSQVFTYCQIAQVENLGFAPQLQTTDVDITAVLASVHRRKRPQRPIMSLPHQAAADNADYVPHVTENLKNKCQVDVLELFPDIDPAHMNALCEERLWDSHQVIQHILDSLEEGIPYPKPARTSLKRKRSADKPAVLTPASAAKKWDNEERRARFQDPRSTYTKTR